MEDEVVKIYDSFFGENATTYIDPSKVNIPTLDQFKMVVDLSIRPDYTIYTHLVLPNKKMLNMFKHSEHNIIGDIKIIVAPQKRYRGLFKIRFFRMLSSSTREIIEEWHWNQKAYLIKM